MRRIYFTKFLIFVILFGAVNIPQSRSQTYAFKDPALPIGKRVLDLLGRLSIQEKIGFMIATSPAIPRLEIDKYYHGNEALHGVVRPGKYTVFPQAIGLASMWNPALHFDIASAISDEARGQWNALEQGKKQEEKFSDLLTFWSPTINMARDPRWGRTAETYGEDPYLTGVLAVQFIKGLQGNDPNYLKVIATPKHFAANNVEQNRFSYNAKIPMRSLREYYLPAYEMSIKEGKAASIMSSYNAINGVPSTANYFLLTSILRNEWKFNGYVVSDCGAPMHLVDGHQYVKTKEEAAIASLKAGLDLECGDDIFMSPLLSAYQQGSISQAEIDSAVYHILHARMKLGLFDSKELNPYSNISAKVIGSEKHNLLALQAARESIVLLENKNNILPLNLNTLKSIAVVGIHAADSEFGEYSGVPMTEPVSILKGIQAKLGSNTALNHVQWIPIHGREGFEIIPDLFWGTAGLNSSYYSNAEFTGPASKRIDREINISFENAPDPFVPNGPLSVRWDGQLKPTISGKYQFGFLTHDGCRLKINGEILIDSWRRKATRTEFADIELIAGKEYHIEAEYFVVRREPVAKLYWKTPESNKSYADLFHDATVAAQKSEYVIAVIGVNKNLDREGQDRDNLQLSKDQVDFLKAIYQANPKTIVVVISGHTLANTWIKNKIPAVFHAWYPGQAGGTAIAELIFGQQNPSGKLPVTFYASEKDLPSIDDYDITRGRTYQYFKGVPNYPFGFGLSYATFQFSNLKIKNEHSLIRAKFTLQNTSDIDGQEVAQVYVKFLNQTLIMPIKQLKGFKKIKVKKHTSQDVEICIEKNQLRFWDEKIKKFRQITGPIEFQFGPNSEKILLRKTIVLKPI